MRDEDSMTSRSPTPNTPTPNQSPNTSSFSQIQNKLAAQQLVNQQKKQPQIRMQSSLIQMMKAIVKIHNYEIEVNEKQNVLNTFYKHIKSDCFKGYVNETSAIYKLYQDYYIENYYRYGNTVLPSFSLIKNNTLHIYQYQLSKGQINALAIVF